MLQCYSGYDILWTASANLQYKMLKFEDMKLLNDMKV